MKKIITTLIIVILANALFIGFVLAETQKGTVNASELNFRERADTSSNAIDVLYRGAKVTIISEEGEWYKVRYNNEEGYVKKQYITKDSGENNSTNNTTSQNTTNNETNENTTNTSNETTTNNTTVDNTISSGSDTNQPIDIKINKTKIKENTTIYVLPLINSTKLGKVNANTEVLLISVNGNWAYVQTENNSGWVITKTLSNATIEPTTTSEPTATPTPEPTTTPKPTATPTPEPTTSNSEYPITMYVNVDAVNVRKSANTSSEIVTSVEKNTSITVEAKEGEWYKVKTSDGSGYIKGEYLSKNKKN